MPSDALHDVVGDQESKDAHLLSLALCSSQLHVTTCHICLRLAKLGLYSIPILLLIPLCCRPAATKTNIAAPRRPWTTDQREIIMAVLCSPAAFEAVMWTARNESVGSSSGYALHLHITLCQLSTLPAWPAAASADRCSSCSQGVLHRQQLLMA